jgi:bifunctional DNA-binding transcriptional regulator/antitoxin component of YhaV-PrlF toxin-antitoxin module
MDTLARTRMSSKGQIVIPEARQQARQAGLKRKDIAAAVSKARRHG